MARISKRHTKICSQKFQRVTSPFFEFDASIRIGGAGKYHDEISASTGLTPTRAYLAGDKVSTHSERVRKEDMWIFSSPLDRSRPLDDHVGWLLDTVTPHIEYLDGVINNATWADLCLGCFSDIPYPMIATGNRATELIKKLNLQISFNFTCT
ncbi:DUF4279 domain-containing protein [Undibacterium terreum]|uniref:DUF4279 domain-containing protein n=1 Tax=Undibacterium terreum TaxID=1224302 RepID=UPI0035316EEE